MTVIAGAGDIEGRLTPMWLGRPVEVLLAQSLGSRPDVAEGGDGLPLAVVPGRTETFDAVLHASDDRLLIELEPAPLEPRSAIGALATLDRMGAQFERAADLQSLCDRAAIAFRHVTGFDRVMIYRFLDDGAGKVLSEDRDAALPSFLNHHFPAGDIPRQARALYVRNPVRVIPDLAYTPAPIRPATAAMTDLSCVGLRSVSPIHLQYMANMGVAASASISIVKDGLLWGLVACHHKSARTINREARAICQTMAGEFARAIRAKEESEALRERIRLRSAEDHLLAQLDPDMSPDAMIAEHGEELCALLGGDGLAAFHGGAIVTVGTCPAREDLRELHRWLSGRTVAEPFATQRLATRFAPAAAYRDVASGVLALALSSDIPMLLVWFRAEEPQIVEWAGNPHKDVAHDPAAILRPRTSFEAWAEEVSGCSRRWTRGEVESAVRLRRRLIEQRLGRRLRELNRELTATVAEKDGLLQQKDHLLREVNHRVQNSLQLVQSFLALQARSGGETGLVEVLDEAQRRISAVALVHRRLYQADELESIDLARYVEELIGEMRAAMGGEWGERILLNLTPILILADRAIHVGLILTELIINANKYAYGGAPGPIEVTLEQYRNSFRLIVADNGMGRPGASGRQGFGTRMMTAMVARLDGTIERKDNQPGLRVIVSAPIDV